VVVADTVVVVADMVTDMMVVVVADMKVIVVADIMADKV
jgi:hypothetical protein